MLTYNSRFQQFTKINPLSDTCKLLVHINGAKRFGRVSSRAYGDQERDRKLQASLSIVLLNCSEAVFTGVVGNESTIDVVVLLSEVERGC